MQKHIYTISEITSLSAPIFKKNKITNAYIFGSYARGTANETSDIDFLVDIEGSNVKSLLGLGAVYCELEDVFKKRIDLITTGSLEQKANMPSDLEFRKRVLAERIQL